MFNNIKYVSFSFLIIFVVFSLNMYIATENVSDNDTWWHLKTGEYILTNKDIPHYDIFSFYGKEKELEWISHEWLSDVILYKIYSLVGFKGLILFPPILLLLTMLTLLYLFKDKYKENYLTAAIWLFTSGFVLALFSSTRPHMFSFLLFALTILILDKFLKEDTKFVFVLPIISLFWVNLHGGSSTLIFVLIVSTLLFNSFNFSFERIKSYKMSPIKIKKLSFILILSLITALINPYGYRMLLYPFINMLDKTMLTVITEWHSPNFHNPEGLVIFVVIIISLIPLFISKKEISVFELIIFVAFLYLSLKSIRQISYFVISISPIILNHLPVISRKENKKSILNLVIVLLMIIFISFNYISLFNQPIDESEYPKNSLSFIEKEKPKRLLNDYNWGGYLIWNLYNKDIFAFIDGRADIFSKHTINDYDKIFYAREGWEESFNKYQFDAVLLPKDNNLIKILLKTNDWEIKHQDDVSIFLIKSRDQ